MRVHIATGAILAVLAAPATSQNPIATPAGKSFETQDGSDQLARGWRIGYAYNVGSRPTAHYQYIDDELNGTLRVFKGIGFRMDNKSHTTSSGAGAKWSNVTLKLSEKSFTSISTTFAANLISPTTVFSGAVSWPTYTGWVGSSRPPNPAPYTAAHKFPFPTGWVYTGVNAIVQDYVFTGGTLNNNASWTFTNTRYHLDGAIIVTSMGTGTSRFPSGSTCNDSAVSSTNPAQMFSQYQQFSKAFPGPKNNTIDVWVQSQYTAPSAPVIHGVGIAALNNGVGIPIGFNCHNLILDTSLFIAIGATAGALPKAETPRVILTGPQTAANLGLTIWMQGAWTDSSSGKPSLTTAARARAPNLGMTHVLPKKLLLSSTSTTAPTGSMAGHASWTSYPLTFFDL